MKQVGIIKGFSTIIDYQKLGLGLTAFIGLSMDDSRCCQEDVFTELENIPRVLEAHFTNGDEDILVKVVTENTETLVELLGKMNAIDGVNRTKTMIALKTPIERSLR
jgi:Lrp/AsnC family transcriptional regulator for asnA, asnC and gidA